MDDGGQLQHIAEAAEAAEASILHKRRFCVRKCQQFEMMMSVKLQHDCQGVSPFNTLCYL